MPVALVREDVVPALAGIFSEICVTTIDMDGKVAEGDVVVAGFELAVDVGPDAELELELELLLAPEPAPELELEPVLELALDSVLEDVFDALFELAPEVCELESDLELDPEALLALACVLAPEEDALEAALPVLLALGWVWDGPEAGADEEPPRELEADDAPEAVLEAAVSDGAAARPLTDPKTTAGWPEAAVATLVARLEAEPQPNCVKPPAKEFL